MRNISAPARRLRRMFPFPSTLRPSGSVLHSHWSSANEARLSLVERLMILLAPALSLNAIKNQHGSLIAPRVLAALVLYGKRELAPDNSRNVPRSLEWRTCHQERLGEQENVSTDEPGREDEEEERETTEKEGRNKATAILQRSTTSED